MGANTTVYVEVHRLVKDIVEVNAVDTLGAELKAESLPGVAAVIRSAYDIEDLLEDGRVPGT